MNQIVNNKIRSPPQTATRSLQHSHLLGASQTKLVQVNKIVAMFLWSTSIWLPLIMFFVIALFVKRTVTSKKQKLLPPGPPALPIIGNLHQLGTLPHQALHELSKKYGPVIFLKFGSVPTVVVSSPETAKEILKVHDVDCCSRPRLAGTGKLSYNYLDIAFSPFDDYWREVRKLCVLELFSSKRLKTFRHIREDEINVLIDSVAQFASSKTSLNIGEKLNSHAAGLIFRIGFGMNFRNSQLTTKKFQEVIYEAAVMLGSFSATDFFPYVGWIIDRISGLHKRREKSFHDLDVIYDEAIELHLQGKKTEQAHDDIIDVLLKVEKDEVALGTGRFTRNHTKAVLMDILLGGIDTAAVSMEWMMTELMKNPRVMKKVQTEVRDTIGNKGKVDEEDLDQLPYLQMVIKESFRIHPPSVILIPRETISEFKLNGYTIYPKTRVQVNVWAIGRDPNVWKDADKFMPERFIDSPIDYKGTNFELLPFSAGRRICPAISMGQLMVELAIANLLYHFDWSLPDGVEVEDIDMTEEFSLIVHKKIPLQVVPVKYQWD